jgi:hypothetical protein
MQTGTVLVAALFALTSFPFLGQATLQDNSPGAPGMQQQTAPSTNPTPGAAPNPQQEQLSPAATADAQASVPSSSPPQLKPVSAELVSALDTKTAKAGDSIVVQTKSSVKTADGTDIPKGTKLVGQVVGVQPSTAGDTSQVAVHFDHAELASGQNVPIQSQIQSIGLSKASAASGNATGSGANRGATADSNSPTSPAAGSSASAQSAPGATGSAAQPSTSPSAASGASNSEPAPGTVVAKTGQIDIRTTAVPGVLLANNQPGQQDPRMAHASSVLLGAHKDVQLSGGTPLVMGVATSGSAATGSK